MLKSGVCLFVLLFCATRIMYGQAAKQSCSCNPPGRLFSDGVNLVVYKCNKDGTSRRKFVYPISEPEGLLKKLNRHKLTIFYTFGFPQKPQDPNVELIMKALCYKKTDNVVLVDWSKYSSGDYKTVVKNAQKVGRLLAQCIKRLKEHSFDVSKLYLIGHSLGSHISGFVGKCNDFVIPRITGLDPANPKYYPPGCYLTKTDAAWIDIIHTDMGGYGAYPGMGTADYIANNGSRPQPGCGLNGKRFSKEDFCSHQKSVQIYAESKHEKITATQCPSYLSYETGVCDGNLETCVGYKASDVKGTYYFTTGK